MLLQENNQFTNHHTVTVNQPRHSHSPANNNFPVATAHAGFYSLHTDNEDDVLSEKGRL